MAKCVRSVNIVGPIPVQAKKWVISWIDFQLPECSGEIYFVHKSTFSQLSEPVSKGIHRWICEFKGSAYMYSLLSIRPFTLALEGQKKLIMSLLFSLSCLVRVIKGETWVSRPKGSLLKGPKMALCCISSCRYAFTCSGYWRAEESQQALGYQKEIKKTLGKTSKCLFEIT